MKRRFWLGGLVAAIVVVVGVVSFWRHQSPEAKPNDIGRTATIYLSGYGANPHAADYLISQAEKVGGTQVLTARVATNGKVTWTGSAKHVAHPLVQVVFDNSRPTSHTQPTTWVHNVALQLKSRYGVQRLNVVAHSAGNLNFMNYAVKWGTDANVPKVNAYVALAGHYDGILGMDDSPHKIHLNAAGKPTPENSSYRPLLANRQKLPKHMRILNIFGDIQNGSDSDGTVSNNSSRSLRYLVATSGAQYQERQFNGKTARHSALRENVHVAKAVDDFLKF